MNFRSSRRNLAQGKLEHFKIATWSLSIASSNENHFIQQAHAPVLMIRKAFQSSCSSRRQACTAWASNARQSSTITQPPRIATLLRPSRERPAPSAGDTIKVNGFVSSVRKQKRVAFAAIADGSTLEILQAVLTPEQAEGLSTGVGVSITGQWQPSPVGKQQSYELHAQDVQVLGENNSTSYPLQKKYHTPEFLRTIPHLRSRLPINALLLRLRSEIIAQLTNFFANREFVETHPPIITSSDCEGAGEVFTVSAEGSTAISSSDKGTPRPHEELFFRSPKYLTVSAQLHLEALAASVGKVWTLSPTFRAERSDTPRHLSEFYMLEVEMSFVNALDPVMQLVEDMLRDVGSKLLTSRIGQELLRARSNVSGGEDASSVTHDVLLQRWQGLVHGPWPRITYAEAIARLRHASSQENITFEFEPSLECGLQAEHEKFLAENVGQGSPVFVTDYPRILKPFYMAPSRSDTENSGLTATVACFDLLVPELCELVGGSLREHRWSALHDAMESQGLLKPSRVQETHDAGDPPSHAAGDESHPTPAKGLPSLQWYLDLRRYGSVPHGGFGLGFDRLLSYLSGVSNIRDTVAFPRWYKRCDA